jgi:hypothetical protein
VIEWRGAGFYGEPIRLAVTELITRRVLSLVPVERQRRRGAERVWGLTDGPAARAAVEPPLDAILELVRETRQPLPVLREGSTMAVTAEGVLVKDLKRSVRKRFRHADEYRLRHVAPALVRRGLLEQNRSPGRKRAIEFDWTAAGREADAQLSRWLELARDHLADWVRTDRARALAFTKEAGSAVLLMKEQFPELDELSRHVGVSAADGAGDPLGDAPHHHAAPGGPMPGDPGLGDHDLDLGGLGDLGLDFGGLLDLGGGLGDFGGGGGDGGGGGGGNGGGG